LHRYKREQPKSSQEPSVPLRRTQWTLKHISYPSTNRCRRRAYTPPYIYYQPHYSIQSNRLRAIVKGAYCTATRGFYENNIGSTRHTWNADIHISLHPGGNHLKLLLTPHQRMHLGTTTATVTLIELSLYTQIGAA
jgi:hypothetical protein